jgi:hypothetical protein
MFHDEMAWVLHWLHCSDPDHITTQGRVFSPELEIATRSTGNTRVCHACTIGRIFHEPVNERNK